MLLLFKFVLSLLLISFTKSLPATYTETDTLENDPTIIPTSFWITVELLSVDWKQGCLTQANCGKPRLQMSKALTLSEEKVSVSWPVTSQMFQDGPKTFVSSWNSGTPEEVSLACQVIGVDPQYGFTRICDETHTVKLFKRQIVNEYIKNNEDKVNSQNNEDEVKGKMLVEVRGQCFNASLTVRKHMKRCPWCPKKKEPTFEVTGDQEMDPQPQQLGFLQDQTFHLSIITLLGFIALLTSLAFVCLLLTHIKQKKDHNKLKSNVSQVSTNNSTGPRTMIKLTRPIPSHYHQAYMYMPSTNSGTLPKKTRIKGHYDLTDHTYSVAADLIRSDAEESGYETPWEKKSHVQSPPIPYWQGHPVTGRSTEISSPPHCVNDNGLGRRNYLALVEERGYSSGNSTSTTSANSSINNGPQNDSGLEHY
uniref:Sushi domain-containing protein n=1 Tax=Strongyloides venezuelensis TaxID=75913 RepID=A0A0K0F9P3_STRVS